MKTLTMEWVGFSAIDITIQRYKEKK